MMLSACTDSDGDYDPGVKLGEFGVGAFVYRCPGAGDPTCPNGEGAAPTFPKSLALGSQVDLEFIWQDDGDHWNDPIPELRSATSTRLRDDGTRFTALEPGFVAVLAVTGNSEVVEIVHFEIAEIDELRAIDSFPGDFSTPLQGLDLVAGDERDLQGFVVDIYDVKLGGILPYSWASEDPELLEILSGGNSGRVRVAARSPGTTNLVLTQGEHVLTLPVTIEPGFDPTGSSGDTDASSSDSSGDTTAGTTADTTNDSTGTAGTTADTDTSGGSTGTTGGVL